MPKTPKYEPVLPRHAGPKATASMPQVQTALDTEVMQRIIGFMRSQRNEALDALAVSEARLQKATGELEAAKMRIKELEPAPAAKARRS